MEKSKNTGLVVTIIILVIALLGASGFIVYDKFINKTSNEEEVKTKDNNDNKEKNENEEKDFQDYEVLSKFEKKYSEYKLYYINEIENNITDFNSIDNQLKLSMAYSYITDYITDGRVWSKNINKLYFKNVFKNEIEFKNEDFGLCDKGEYHIKYFEEGYYDWNPDVGGHGSDYTDEYYSKLLNIKKIGKNQYKFTYAKLFVTMSDGGYPIKYYNKYNYDESIDKPVITVPDSIINSPDYENIDNNIKKYVYEQMESIDNFDNFPKYSYTVELSDTGDVLLVGYEYSE